MRLLLAAMLLTGCQSGVPTCGKIIRVEQMRYISGEPIAFVAIVDSSGTVHQGKIDGIWGVGDRVCP